MKCPACDSEKFELVTGTYHFSIIKNEDERQDLEIPSAKYFECKTCGETYLSRQTVNRIVGEQLKAVNYNPYDQ